MNIRIVSWNILPREWKRRKGKIKGKGGGCSIFLEFVIIGYSDREGFYGGGGKHRQQQ